jgi:hypothetical protein
VNDERRPGDQPGGAHKTRQTSGPSLPGPAGSRSKTNFTCEHCGRDVPWARFEGQRRPRDHCPFCLWSKHVSTDIGGQAGYPPCGAMMRGTDLGSGEAVWRCLGCGFMMRGYTDDYLLSGVLNDALGSAAMVTLYGRRQADGARPRKCGALTRNLTRCALPPEPGSDRCALHRAGAP